MATSKNYTEPEETIVDSAIPAEADNYSSPLSGAAVKEKGYTRTNARVNPDQLTADIPEPGMKAPPIDLTKPQVLPDEFQADPGQSSAQNFPPGQQQGGQGERPQPQSPINPQMRDMKPKDKRDAAERMADTILDGYGWLKGLSNQLLQISETKVKKLQVQGKINITLILPMAADVHGRRLSIAEYIQLFNEQNQDTLRFEPEDREAIRPVMVQFFAEQGIGMTVRDELIYLGIKELATWGIGLFMGLKAKRDMITALTEATKNLQGGGVPPGPAAQAAAAPVTPHTPEPDANNGNDGGGQANSNATSFGETAAMHIQEAEIVDDEQTQTYEEQPLQSSHALVRIGAVDANPPNPKKKGRPKVNKLNDN